MLRSVRRVMLHSVPIPSAILGRSLQQAQTERLREYPWSRRTDGRKPHRTHAAEFPRWSIQRTHLRCSLGAHAESLRPFAALLLADGGLAPCELEEGGRVRLVRSVRLVGDRLGRRLLRSLGAVGAAAPLCRDSALVGFSIHIGALIDRINRRVLSADGEEAALIGPNGPRKGLRV